MSNTKRQTAIQTNTHTFGHLRITNYPNMSLGWDVRVTGDYLMQAQKENANSTQKGFQDRYLVDVICVTWLLHHYCNAKTEISRSTWNHTNPGGTWPHNSQFQRLLPYPLGHWALFHRCLEWRVDYVVIYSGWKIVYLKLIAWKTLNGAHFKG